MIVVQVLIVELFQIKNTLCVATYQADMAPVLMGFGATIYLASPKGTRSVLIKDFFKLDGIKKIFYWRMN